MKRQRFWSLTASLVERPSCGYAAGKIGEADAEIRFTVFMQICDVVHLCLSLMFERATEDLNVSRQAVKSVTTRRVGAAASRRVLRLLAGRSPGLGRSPNPSCLCRRLAAGRGPRAGPGRGPGLSRSRWCR